jgi:hypothetical protein
MSMWPFIIVGTILLALAAPPAYVEGSWKRFGQTLALSFVGVVLPLIVFLLSAFLVPEWKGGCKLGWVDCFHLGKLALLPLVLWATGAWYAVEVLRVEHRTSSRIVLPLWMGASVAGICLVFGVISLGAGGRVDGGWLWLFVPFYVAVWHGARAVQLSRAGKVRAFEYLLALLGSVPFWIISVFWSRQIYESLPDNPPSCFVVTAAARGHESVVGPFVEVRRRGRVRRANQQLLTLWQFEALWQVSAPRSHQIFRRAYNVIGPAVARRIVLPWLADLAYLCLKPVEFFAVAALCVVRTTQSEWRPTTHPQS